MATLGSRKDDNFFVRIRRVLETERLRLSLLRLEDIGIILAVWGNPEVMYVVGDVMTPEEVVGYKPIADKRADGGWIGIWCIARKDTGQKIGNVVLTPVSIDEDDTDWSQILPDADPKDQIEVGYHWCRLYGARDLPQRPVRVCCDLPSR